MMSDLRVDVASLIGHRDSNEDMEDFILNLSADGRAIDLDLAPIDFFVVCDGHGGDKVSKFITPILKKFFMKRITGGYPLKEEYINRIFLSLQSRLIDNGIGKDCGSTVLVVIRYITRGIRYLQTINLGDCRAVVSVNGYAIQLTKDHKPDWPDEKRRIIAEYKKKGLPPDIQEFDGAWRVNSDLSVSRALGDIEHMPYVGNLPDSNVFKITDNTEFLIIACDGLWDALENHDAVNFVSDLKSDNHVQFYGKYRADNIANSIATYAINKGSMDNVSVIIVHF